MSIYAMSDIHGSYDKYIKMLDVIGFSDDDTLFVLGDVIDRGDRPVDVLKDMMSRPNIYPLMGNHDLLALDVLKKLSVEITEENHNTQINDETMEELDNWFINGGRPTLEALCQLPHEELGDIIDYISAFSLYEAIDVGEKTFILVHAGLGNFRKDKRLSEYTVQELLMQRSDPGVKYFDDDSVYIVSGHTPTQFISGKAEIYKRNNNICIDCGAYSDDGKLACICLDTMEEFYV